jgi:hypothetical protein
MNRPEAKAITVVWSNIPKEKEDEIRKWHNLEHSTERLEGPGYIACRRYNIESGDGRHKRLTVFEGEDLATFDSPYYLESRNNPTPWTRQSLGVIKDAQRSVYTLEATSGDRPRIEPPYIYTFRCDPAEGAEEEVVSWYHEEHLPRLCTLDCVVRARLFRRNAASDSKTEETKMQGKQDGQLALIAIYEMSTLEPIGSAEWKEAASGTPRSDETLQKIVGAVREMWWWDFVKYAPRRI